MTLSKAKCSDISLKMAKARTWAPKHFFFGGGGGFEKKWVYISFRFRVAQNLVLMTF